MQQPAWMAPARAELGVREAPGRRHTPAIVKYFKECGHGDIANDETPWCAAFVGAMLKRAGLSGTGSLMARSYLKWGTKISEPRPGAITVLTRGSNPAFGHVGFLIRATADTVELLGGNQGDSVSIAKFPKSRVLGYRWPKGATAKLSVAANLDVAPDVGEVPRGREVDPETVDVFARALGHVLDMEGGFSDDPHDPGGPTNRGITLEVYARWVGATVTGVSRARLIDDLKRIPDEMVSAIYLARYWQPSKSANLPAPVALMHFDASVNHGVSGAARLLQAAVETKIDGDIGKATLAAARALSASEIVTRYAHARRERYRGLPHFWRFGKGWLARVDATESLAKNWANEAWGQRAPEKFDDDVANPKKGRASMTTIDTRNTTKWWLQSKTIWGALITAATTVVPVIGPLIGINLPGDVIRDVGDQAVTIVQAVGGFVGTLLTIYGRMSATKLLSLRAMTVKM